MSVVGARQLSMLALAAAMVAIGVVGLVGTVTPTLGLAAVLLVAAIVLVFDAGRRSVGL